MPATAAGLTAFMPALSSVEVSQDPFERVYHRLPAHTFPIAPKLLRLAPGRARARPGEAHHAHRLARAAAAGSGHASHRQRHAATPAAERALRHLARGLLADRAVFLQRVLAHAEQLALGVVRIGDEAALEPVGRAGHRGRDLRRPAAGARLGGDQLRARGLQALAELARKSIHQKNSRLTAANSRSE